MQNDITKQPLTWLEGEQYADRVIVCAANKYELTTGEVLVIPCVRHTNPVLSKQVKILMDAGLLKNGWCRPDDQGFIDQYYNWWSREDALIIAKQANQVNFERNGHDRDLFSEGLY